MTWRKGKCVISIMDCPLKELDTSALSASPWRLTEGVLEVEGPTSADAGVASCLLFNAEPVFRRLRDDLLEGKILAVGMIRLGGFELQKRLRGSALWPVGLSRRNNGKLELGVGRRRETLRSRATLNGKASERLLSARNETKENFYATQDFLQQPPNVSTLIYIS